MNIVNSSYLYVILSVVLHYKRLLYAKDPMGWVLGVSKCFGPSEPFPGPRHYPFLWEGTITGPPPLFF
jgi:hypothetical protein